MFHIRLTLRHQPLDRVALDLDENTLIERFVGPYLAGQVFMLNGEAINPAEVRAFRVNETATSSADLLPEIQRRRAQQRVAVAVSNEWYVTNEGVNVTDRYITRPPTAPAAGPDAAQDVVALCARFGASARALKQRQRNRPDFEIRDEYDVQDLLLSLLRARFDDVRPEEWTPSYLAKSTRMDFLLKEEGVVVEAKMTRDGLTDKTVGEQLGIDVLHYAQYHGIHTLVCFIYDPDHRVRNPGGIVADLSAASTGQLRVAAVIAN